MDNNKKPLDGYVRDLADVVIAWYKQSVKDNYSMKDLYNQLLRAATSVGANCAEAKRAVSPADYKNKIGIALKEAEETSFWIERLKISEDIAESIYNEMRLYLDNIIPILVSLYKKYETS